MIAFIMGVDIARRRLLLRAWLNANDYAERLLRPANSSHSCGTLISRSRTGCRQLPNTLVKYPMPDCFSFWSSFSMLCRHLRLQLGSRFLSYACQCHTFPSALLR